MRSASPNIETELRRLLVGLERPAFLDEWRRREPLGGSPTASAEERRDFPKAA